MRRAVVAGVTLLLVGGVGYAAADVADLAPGILTYDGAPVDPPTPTGSPSASPVWAALPSAAPATATPSPTATAAGAVPTTAGLTKALAALAKDPWLGPSVGISVRDGVTGTEPVCRVPQCCPRTSLDPQGSSQRWPSPSTWTPTPG